MKLIHLSALWPLIEWVLYMKGRGIVFKMVGKFIKKELSNMDKTFQIGDVGSLQISASGGALKLIFVAQKSLGGGAAAGLAVIKSTDEIDVNDVEGAKLAIDFIKGKLPESLQGLVGDAEAAILAALAA